MEEKDKRPVSVIDQAKEYAKTNVKLAKYEALDKGSSVAGEIITDVAQIICFLFIIGFASLTLGFYLSDILGSFWAGFGCVFVLFLVIFLGTKIFKKNIEKTVVNSVVRKFFKHL